MLQLHKILVGLVIVGFFAVVITSFISLGTVEYNQNAENMTQFNTTFNKMQDLSQDINNYEVNSTPTTDSSILDILGSFFTNMYQSARVLKNSVGVVGDMSDATLDNLPAGSNSGVLKTAVGLIILILISVGIFLAFVTKSDRT